MLVGYARLSTSDHTLDLQLDALETAGVERVFTDRVSDSRANRPGLAEAIDFVSGGDTLIVWRLDRLGRSLPHLIATLQVLADGGVGFRSLIENIDTTRSGGELVLQVFGALAEFEHDLIRERTQAGLLAARARGRKGGRPNKLDTGEAATAKTLHNDKTNSIAEICHTLGISRTTLYRYLKHSEVRD